MLTTDDVSCWKLSAPDRTWNGHPATGLWWLPCGYVLLNSTAGMCRLCHNFANTVVNLSATQFPKVLQPCSPETYPDSIHEQEDGTGVQRKGCCNRRSLLLVDSWVLCWQLGWLWCLESSSAKLSSILPAFSTDGNFPLKPTQTLSIHSCIHNSNELLWNVLHLNSTKLVPTQLSCGDLLLQDLLTAITMSRLAAIVAVLWMDR
jgi:hypothetical protein